MRISLERPAHRAAISVVVFAMFWIPWTPARVIATFLSVGVLPGLAIAMHRRSTLDAALGIGTSIAPVIFVVSMLLTMVFGASVQHAAVFASGTALILFPILAAPPLGGDPRAIRGALAIFAVAAILALALPLADTWWRVREDSWFHAAVANKLARDGLPLDDPYFAGIRIQYMYAYHAIVAGCASLSGLDYLRAMILVNAIALASSVLAFHALAGQFTRRVGPRVFATVLWIFGMNGWFYLSYPVRFARALIGETQGLETLQSLFRWTPVGHSTAMNLLSVDGNQFMFLDKFMIGTALSLTFGLAATLLLLLIRGRRGEWSVRDDVAFISCLAGTLLLHLVTGLTIVVATALVLALLLIIRAQPTPRGPSYARLVAWIAVAVVATLPYIYSVLPRGGGQVAIVLSLQRSQFVGLLFAVLPALVFATIFMRSATRDTPETAGSRPFAEMSLSATGIVALWTVIVAAIALTFDLVTNNETKFAFLLYLPLASLAAGGVEQLWDRRRALAIMLVASATLPLHAIYFYHAFRDPSRFDVSDSERAVNAWIEKKTPEDAVFIEAHDTVRIPVLASRDTYWGTEAYARNWGYARDEMFARKELRDRFYSEDGPGEFDMNRLRALGRPVYVIYRDEPGNMIDANERFENDARFHGRFVTPEIAVWELFVEDN